MAMTEEIRTAANNAVAVASVAYAMNPSQEELSALKTVLSCAAGHGLTVAELRYASGLDEAFIGQLLEEAS